MRIKVIYRCLFDCLSFFFVCFIALNSYIFFIIICQMRVDVTNKKCIEVKNKNAKLSKIS